VHRFCFKKEEFFRKGLPQGGRGRGGRKEKKKIKDKLEMRPDDDVSVFWEANVIGSKHLNVGRVAAKLGREFHFQVNHEFVGCYLANSNRWMMTHLLCKSLPAFVFGNEFKCFSEQRIERFL
jgi:hypothetical protein